MVFLGRQTFLLFLLLLMIGAMFAAPQEVVAGAAAGISLWALCVLPALLPFFIVSDLLVEQGVVDFLGVLCEPLMRPLFRLPGCAAFVVAIVHTTGMPMGAVLTARLRESGQVSRTQGERLLAFSCNPSPGFMFGAVAGGMLGVPALGVVLAGSVYVANLIVGLTFRFYGGAPQPDNSPTGSYAPMEHLGRAAHKLRVSQTSSRPFGVIFAESVNKNVATLLQIGGYIVVFSVLIRLLKHGSLLTWLSQIPVWILTHVLPGLSHIQGELIRECAAILTGIIEQTLGCRSVVDAMPTLSAQVGAIAFLMGLGGLCVFAQVSGIVAKTDLRLRPFLLARLLHGLLALGLSQFGIRQLHLSAMSPLWSLPQFTLSHALVQFWHVFKWNLLFFGVFMLLIFILSHIKLRKQRN